MNRAGEARPDDDPRIAGQVTPLRGQYGTDERPGTGDGGKMVAEKDPLVGRVIVDAVAQTVCGRGTLIIENGDFRGQERAIETVRDGECCQGHGDKPQRIHDSSFLPLRYASSTDQFLPWTQKWARFPSIRKRQYRIKNASDRAMFVRQAAVVPSKRHDRLQIRRHHVGSVSRCEPARGKAVFQGCKASGAVNTSCRARRWIHAEASGPWRGSTRRSG